MSRERKGVTMTRIIGSSCGRVVLTSVVGFALSIGLSPISFMRQLDSDKTFVPLCDAIKTNETGKTVVGFDLSEMERGVIGFYLDKTFVNVRAVEDLNRWLDASRSQKTLLIVNRNRLADLTPVLQGKTRIIFEYRPDQKTRSYQLYESS